MIRIRSLAISFFWAAVSAPLIGAQDEKPSEARVMAQSPPVIQELGLRPQRFLDSSSFGVELSAPLIHGQDLSRYRGFQFGTGLLSVTKQTGMKASEARTIHQRPALIQELEWQPQHFLGGSSLQTDPVEKVLFSFYNGELFRIVVNYDRYKTEGLTDKDMIEAISEKYGTATRPTAKTITFSSSQVYNDSEKVIARWEDAQYSFNLFRSSYEPTFGIVVFSKRLDALARAAVAEAIRLDEQEAPQREAERQKRQDEENRTAQEKSRQANKATFQP